MTADQRHALRHAVDQARRAQIERARARNPEGYCTSCGNQLDDINPDCRRCRERQRARQRRHQHGIPCTTGCGRLVQPPEPNRYKGRWTGMCRTCWAERNRMAA